MLIYKGSVHIRKQHKYMLELPAASVALLVSPPTLCSLVMGQLSNRSTLVDESERGSASGPVTANAILKSLRSDGKGAG